jgi:uncharacterized damage-inducible protein DinB
MTSLLSLVTTLFLRDLETLKREIGAFPDDKGPWATRPGVTNTAGTLALHCAGNIQHFIGARLGGSSYVRNRDAEFSRRDVPRAEILAELDKAIAAVHLLDGKTDADLPRVFPDPFGGKQVDTDAILVFLSGHLTYHLGQIDYYRRLITGDGSTMDTISAKALPPAS